MYRLQTYIQAQDSHNLNSVGSTQKAKHGLTATEHVPDWATGSRMQRIRLSGVTSVTWNTAFIVRQTAPIQLSSL